MEIRPMRTDDVVACEEICDVAFLEADLAAARRDDPVPQPRSPERKARWIERTARLVATDPGGCWVVESEGGLVGFATSLRRGGLWALVTFAVLPGRQGGGIGARLLAAAERHGDGADRALLSASEHPGALRRYHRAGFELHPQLELRGYVDPTAVAETAATGPAVRPGTAADQGWMDDLDRLLRGGPHGPDHASLAAMAPLWVAEDRSGYTYASTAETFVVAGRDDDTARSLLAHALRDAAGTFTVGHVTTANRWAIDLSLRAGLLPSTRGYLGVRGGPAPTSYLHNGALL